MRRHLTKGGVRQRLIAERRDAAATQNWENEGGSPRDGTPAHDHAQEVRRNTIDEPTSNLNSLVDSLQDELMSAKSSDGGPPSRGWRLTGWHWLVVLVPLLAIVCGVVWTSLAMGVWTALAGLVLLAVMGLAAAPVWGAGLLRGREERAARRQSRARLRVETDVEVAQITGRSEATAQPPL